MSKQAPTQKQIAARFKVTVDAVKQWRKRHKSMPKAGSAMEAYEAWHAEEIAPHENSKPSKEERDKPAGDGESLSLREQKTKREIQFLESKIKEKEGQFVDKEVHRRAIVGTIEMVREWYRDWSASVIADCSSEMVTYVSAILKTGLVDLCDTMRTHVGPVLAASSEADFDKPGRKGRAVHRRHARRT